MTTDPISKMRDGLMKRPNTDPLVFQTDTNNEFWAMKASLNVADGQGRPVAIPDNARLYFLSSFPHAGNNPPERFPGPAGTCELPNNPLFQGTSLRALFVALDAWADRGVKPPDSNYPTVRNGTLVPLEEARKAYPNIPGVNFPTVMNELELLDFGPSFTSTGGTLTVLPPKRGRSYKVFVPKADEDGLDIAGIRPVEIRVPLGTNTGWNVRAGANRGPNLCGLSGSYIPFATTRIERLASGDPRKSLEERYRDHQGYVNAVRGATRKLVQERFLLEEDAKRFIDEAEASDVLKNIASATK